ncbi:PQQ-binding-like beta-propeller repeat protein [Falsihalocynthiibacter sp. BN13B15]|uniref:outer membrane protein assembly factor BamB family protein n=1 Tax=Falsihalocynthiibacter sp. BN13B15 TaxID=3240871 RepID=UPI00350F93EA
MNPVLPKFALESAKTTSVFAPSRFGLKKAAHLFAGLAVVALLAACAKDEVILPGERIGLRAPFGAQEPATAMVVETRAEVTLPPAPSFSARRPVTNSAWTHSNGSPQHHIDHPALAQTIRPLWSVDIGEGDSRKYRISTTPVAKDGRIFTMDSQSLVMAHNTSGALLWKRNLTPITDSPEDVSGGGLAISGDILVATTGFGEMVALDVKTGGEVWAQRVDANIASPPTIYNGLVYAISRNNVAWAVNLSDGRVKWQLANAPSDSGIIGGAAPAATNDVAIFPFSTGEMIATFPQGGVRLWSTTISGRRVDSAYAGITDITSEPVILGNTVYAGNASGRTIKFNRANGDVVWTAQEGAYGPVWPEGNSVFLVNDQSALVRLSAATGETLWKVDLPYFVEEKIKKRKTIYAHYGPVLAGGRLWVGSSDGVLRSFDPQNGQLLSTVPLPEGATTAPIVVNNTLYIVTGDGALRAYR